MTSFAPLTVASAVSDGLTPYVNSRGEEFVQLHQRLGPFAKYLYFNFELNFDPHPYTEFARNHTFLPLGIVAAYVVLVFGVAHYKKTRERHDLRMPLVYWNLFLCVFSFMGALRTVPDLMYRLGSSETLEETICTPSSRSWGVGATGLWVMLFIYSKIPELVDTAFIVLRKRPLLFLHWYHHVTVLLYCWHSFATEAPQALYFVAMNYSVHAIMYLYYFLAAVRSRPPRWGLIVTLLQLAQMAVGIAITLLHLNILVYETVPNCDGHIPNLTAALGMYASYFILFAQFLFNRYCIKREKGKKVD